MTESPTSVARGWALTLFRSGRRLRIVLPPATAYAKYAKFYTPTEKGLVTMLESQRTATYHYVTGAGTPITYTALLVRDLNAMQIALGVLPTADPGYSHLVTMYRETQRELWRALCVTHC